MVKAKLKAVFIFVFFVAYSCHAQPQWAPVGAKWWYGEEDLPVFGPPPYAQYFYTTEVEGQTEIQGKLCSRITDSGCTFCDNTKPCYVYEDSNRVYYFNHQMQQFYLLYDFNLAPDEMYLIYFYDFDSLNYIQVYITDTFSITVNGYPLKAQTADFTIDSYTYTQTLIEVIGAEYNFFPTTISCDIGFKGLRCYQDSTLGLYHYSLIDCEYSTVGIAEQEISGVTIYPNPATNEVTLTNAPPAQTNYTLYDLSGRALRSGSFIQYISISSNDLATGVYLIELVSKQGSSRQKFIKQ